MNRRQLLLASLALPIPGNTAPPASKDIVRIRPKTGELAETTVYTNSWAILIGINRYPKLGGSADLNLAEKDARDLRDLLVRSYGFPAENCTLLLGSAASKSGIENALARLTDGSRIAETDRVLVYFSGHGQTVPLSTGGEMGFLIPSDAKVDLKQPQNRSGYFQTCLPMNRIWDYFQACPARHRLFIGDACYSGLVLQSKGLLGERPSEKVLKGLLEVPAIQGMSAGAKGEVARESPNLGNSIFTSKLLEKLRFAAATPDEVVLASELGAALKVSVANASENRQHPQFGAFGGTEGEFLFISTAPRGTVVPVIAKPKPTPVPVVVKPVPASLVARRTAVEPLWQRALAAYSKRDDGDNPFGDLLRANLAIRGVVSPELVRLAKEEAVANRDAGYRKEQSSLYLAVAQAGARQFAEARKTLETMSELSARGRGAAFCSWISHEIGENGASATFWTMANEIRRLAPPEKQLSLSLSLANGARKKRDLPEVKKQISRCLTQFPIEDQLRSRSTSELFRLYQLLSDLGDADGARAILYRTLSFLRSGDVNLYLKREIYFHVLISQAHRGDAAFVQKVLDQEPDLRPYEGFPYEALLVDAYARSGDWQKAETELNRVRFPSVQSDARRFLVEAKARAGDFSGAERFLSPLDATAMETRNWALVALARARFRAADLAGGAKTVDRLSTVSKKVEALSQGICAYLNPNHPEDEDEAMSWWS